MIENLDILLTNDDNHESPLLHWLIDLLKDKNRLTVVAPAEEKSWTGKGITCVGTRRVDVTELYGCETFYVDGLPADCVNIGVNHLCPSKPDLIVSGINAGRNTGAAFVMSSGTVGACFEANILEIPAIALSQNLEPELMQQWIRTRELPKNRRQQLKKQVTQMLPTVVKFLEEQPDYLQSPVTWNVNLPSFWHEEKPIQLAPLNTGYYGSIFVKNEEGFHHFITSDQVFNGEESFSDATLLEQGVISVSRLDHLNICATSQAMENRYD